MEQNERRTKANNNTFEAVHATNTYFVHIRNSEVQRRVPASWKKVNTLIQQQETVKAKQPERKREHALGD
jgi:hypothetical protein